MKKIMDLENAVRTAAALGYDHRWKHWTKEITGVDASKSNGYAFAGDFVRSGDIEIELKPRLFLVASETGSAKYRTTDYAVVQMDAQGNCAKTDITTDDSSNGWALRIRDRVAELLNSTSETKSSAVEQLRNLLDKMSEEEASTILANIKVQKPADQRDYGWWYGVRC